MMSAISNEDIMNAAVSIADRLMKNSISDSDRIYWKTLRLAEKNIHNYALSETIYSGNAGIALFFIELYKLTGDARYFEIITKIKNWLIYYCKNNPSRNAAFYTGRSGVAYSLLQIYKLDNEKATENAALEIAMRGLENHDFSLNPDLLSGNASVMLGLMHLYAASKKDWALEQIDKAAGEIISSLNFSLSEGMSWGTNFNNLKNLCGFSHGVSGVAFSFLELGNYFNLDAFIWLARQAIVYENNLFKNDEWPDYRLMIAKEDFIDAAEKLKNGGQNYLFTPGSYNAWCHGAVGIGLARLRAYSLLHDPHDLTDFDKAITIVQSKNYGAGTNRSYTLCHGLGGFAHLYLDAGNFFKNPDYISRANEIIAMSIDSFKKNNKFRSGYATSQDPDYSMFMGDAGIGYTYLKFLDYNQSGNILIPALGNQCEKLPDLSALQFLSTSKEELVQQVVSRHFPKTISRINKLSEKLFVFDKLPDDKFLPSLKNYFSVLIEKNKSLKELFEFDDTKNNLTNGNFSYYAIRNIVVAENLATFRKTGNDVTKEKLILDENIFVYKMDDLSKNEEPAPVYGLLRIDNFKVQNLEVNKFCYELFTFCKKEKEFSQIHKKFTSLYDIEKNQEEEFLQFLKLQINEAVNSRILIPLLKDTYPCLINKTNFNEVNYQSNTTI